MTKVNSLNNDTSTLTVDSYLHVTAGGLTVTAGATTLTPLASTAATGVITVTNAGVLAEVETGVAGTVFVGTSTSPKFLAGGTTGQMFTATTSSDPAWTTATYPATIAQGDVVIGTGSNQVGVVATAGATSTYVLTANGSGAVPTWQTLPWGGLIWAIRTTDLNPLVPDHGYIANKAGLLLFTLPATCAVGKTIRITGMNTALGWKIVQLANQIIHMGTSTTTTGTAGYVSSTETHNSVELVCCVADLEFIMVSMTGNPTVA